MLFSLIKIDSSPNFDSAPYLSQWTLSSTMDPKFDSGTNIDSGP